MLILPPIVRRPTGRRIVSLYQLSPLSIEGGGNVESITFARWDGEAEAIKTPVGVGCRDAPSACLSSFDDATGTILHGQGRIINETGSATGRHRFEDHLASTATYCSATYLEHKALRRSDPEASDPFGRLAFRSLNGDGECTPQDRTALDSECDMHHSSGSKQVIVFRSAYELTALGAGLDRRRSAWFRPLWHEVPRAHHACKPNARPLRGPDVPMTESRRNGHNKQSQVIENGSISMAHSLHLHALQHG